MNNNIINKIKENNKIIKELPKSGYLEFARASLEKDNEELKNQIKPGQIVYLDPDEDSATFGLMDKN